MKKKTNDELWKDCVKERAGHRCEHCGKTGGYIQAHHIVPSKVWVLRWDTANGVSLCRRCHIYWAHKDVLGFYDWLIQHRTKDLIAYLRIKRHIKTKVDKKLIRLYLEQEFKKIARIK